MRGWMRPPCRIEVTMDAMKLQYIGRVIRKNNSDRENNIIMIGRVEGRRRGRPRTSFGGVRKHRHYYHGNGTIERCRLPVSTREKPGRSFRFLETTSRYGSSGREPFAIGRGPSTVSCTWTFYRVLAMKRCSYQRTAFTIGQDDRLSGDGQHQKETQLVAMVGTQRSMGGNH